MEKGLVLNPTGEITLDVFVDSDFAGLWPHENRLDPTCVKSRTGFVICLSNFPDFWGSKLMPEITLYTMEAKYKALSFCMQQVFPFQKTIKAISQGIGISSNFLTTFRTIVWEDNAGSLNLEKMEPGRVTPKSKH